MPSGNCVCGAITLSYSVAPAAQALCHCLDCQKWGGSGFSSNVGVPTAELTITGAPKKFTRKGISGQDHNLFFCGECGTSLYSQPDSMAGVTFIKSGILDGDASNIDVGVEFFNNNRRKFTSPVDGAQQLKAWSE
ncbi:Mss4-like protein [Mariannaea sp. PMI_226]|nr:Mss4-like protein [Mariannaea sp. PMI_226]